MMQRDFDLGAVGGNHDFLLVVLHRIGAGDFHLADLVGAEGIARDREQGTQGEGADHGFHGELLKASGERRDASASPDWWWCIAGTASWQDTNDAESRRPQAPPRENRKESASSYPGRC